MTAQHPRAVPLGNVRFSDQLASGGGQVTFTQHEVAVANHHVHGSALLVQGLQLLRHALTGRSGQVVVYPVFEKVPQNGQALAVGRNGGDEVVKVRPILDGCQPGRSEMNSA